MDAWYQCENPYPFVPQDVLEGVDSVRASLPNGYCDPKIAADLFEEVLDGRPRYTARRPARVCQARARASPPRVLRKIAPIIPQ